MWTINAGKFHAGICQWFIRCVSALITSRCAATRDADTIRSTSPMHKHWWVSALTHNCCHKRWILVILEPEFSSPPPPSVLGYTQPDSCSTGITCRNLLQRTVSGLNTDPGVHSNTFCNTSCTQRPFTRHIFILEQVSHVVHESSSVIFYVASLKKKNVFLLVFFFFFMDIDLRPFS